MIDLDDTDRAILEILQKDGRLTNVEIASRVSLSPPACWKRLKSPRVRMYSCPMAYYGLPMP